MIGHGLHILIVDEFCRLRRINDCFETNRIVKVVDCIFNEQNINVGVQQGSVFEPVLFRMLLYSQSSQFAE